MKIKLTVLSVVLALAGCASTLDVQDTQHNHLVESNKPVYTLVNLHPDGTRAKLYSLNYQQGGFIPRCTEVDVLSATTKLMEFTVKDTGQTYRYYWHKRTPDFTQNIQKYFGTTCAPLSSTLSDIDKQGISDGEAEIGMTKAAVIQAMGYPPVFRTPKPMASRTWVYWTNRWNTMTVKFDAAGKVSHVNYPTSSSGDIHLF
ncbi:hypothetical protein [Vibrio mediterranei]|uniref:hypothetical protein n=1 Tax=Vibrio mediterranei TaxID=689 RepID=UPI001EFC3EA3|nr:hypothetical protein [Vibrio mediterranei]MCG9658779.1 hypothetical protein [Vibrio mediterranei]